ncbi:ankyrin repeat domain-containing protein, partial [Wolbachia endosymbiont of Drosophila santomea]
VRLLIDKGADVNHRDQQSRTALEYATSNSRFDVVKFLKEKQGLRSRRDVKELGNVSNSTLGSLQESVKPSSYVSDIVLEKTKESNSSFILK